MLKHISKKNANSYERLSEQKFLPLPFDKWNHLPDEIKKRLYQKTWGTQKNEQIVISNDPTALSDIPS